MVLMMALLLLLSCVVRPAAAAQRVFVVPRFERRFFTPVSMGHPRHESDAAAAPRGLQTTYVPAPDAGTNASIAVLISNENKLPDQPVIVGFTPNNGTTGTNSSTPVAEIELGVARDYESDCQKPASSMACRGNFFLPPSLALKPTVSNPSGCPIISGDIPPSFPNPDYLQYSTCYNTVIQTIGCYVSPALEDSYDFSLAADGSGQQGYSCLHFRGANNTCGFGALLRLYWVVSKEGSGLPGTMYQPAFLKLPLYGSDMDEKICFKIAAPPSVTLTATITASSSKSYSATVSTSFSPSGSKSTSYSASATAIPSVSRSFTASISLTPSQTGSAPSTPSNTPTSSTTRTISSTTTGTGTSSVTTTGTRTSSGTASPSGVTFSPTASSTPSRSFSSTVTTTATMSRSFSSTISPTSTNLTSLIGAFASLQAHASQLAAEKEREQQAKGNISAALDNKRNANNATLANLSGAAEAAAAEAAAQQDDLNRRLGIVAGILALLALIALLCCWWFFLLPCWRRRKKEREQKKKRGKAGVGEKVMAATTTGSDKTPSIVEGSDEPLPGKLDVFSSQLEFSHTNALRSPNPMAGGNAGAGADGSGAKGNATYRKSVVAHFNPLSVDKNNENSASANKRKSTHGGANLAGYRGSSAGLAVEKAQKRDLARLKGASDGKQASILEGDDEDGDDGGGKAEVTPIPGSADDSSSSSLSSSADPFASLLLPLDPNLAAYIGCDPVTGRVTNFAAYWAYKLYATTAVEGGPGSDYHASYQHYAHWIEENGNPTEEVYVGRQGGSSSLLSASSSPSQDEEATGVAGDGDGGSMTSTASAAADDADGSASASAAAPARKAGSRVMAPGSKRRTGQKPAIPTNSSAPPPSKLELGVGTIRTSLLLKETVSLRRVNTIRGDKSFKGNKDEKIFTAVKERKKIELPTPKKQGLSSSASSSAESPGGFINRTAGDAGAGFSGTGTGGRFSIAASVVEQ